MFASSSAHLPRHAQPFAGWAILRAALLAVPHALLAHARHRRALREFAALDDHLLADIGVAREDVAFVAREGRLPSRRERDVARGPGPRGYFSAPLPAKIQ